jgi:hypothetical protein
MPVIEAAKRFVAVTEAHKIERAPVLASLKKGDRSPGERGDRLGNRAYVVEELFLRSRRASYNRAARRTRIC